ncbi:MAG: cation-translocating P-type ATPase [Candidatus Bipolaricaulia bacterium]
MIAQPERDWHNLTVDEAFAALGSGPHGLSEEEATRRLAQYGPNELERRKPLRPWLIFFGQFKDFLIILLLLAAAASGGLAAIGEGDLLDPVLIVVIVLFAAALGFLQEYRSERALEALQRMASPIATIIRGGEELQLPARELVPGDVILLHTGDRVPADGRLIEAVNLKTDEAPLTGESVAIEKATEALPGELEVSDRRNMVYMGTTVVYGRGKALITSTGMATEFGKIAQLLQEVEAPPTPLQVSLEQVGKILGLGALAICALVAGAGLFLGMFSSPLAALIWGVSLAVAAVPEALPAVVTITLAIGVQRMAKRHALIRHLPAVETLGCTTYICSDKTGTLTQNEMTVRRLFLSGRVIEVSGAGYEPKGGFYRDGRAIGPRDEPGLELLLRIGALCNDSQLLNVNGLWQVRGDPTEGALLVLAAKAGLDPQGLRLAQPRLSEVPFTSERKMMTTIHEAQTGSGRVAYAKGAPEVILSRSSRLLLEGEERPLTEEALARILAVNREMAASALRVLALAYKPLAQDELPSSWEEGMVFVGLVGMIDPPREEAKAAVQRCKEAKIESVMITGDHRETAVAVAKELGIIDGDGGGLVLSGGELERLRDEEFEAMVERVKVYARVAPLQKIRVVEALQKRGHVVAMTGDGVNDAPALKRADIGVAMGITGTDVSKEAGAMVLTDDNFASIVAAVEEGRRIFANIKKFLAYLLSCNIGEILLMLLAFIITSALGEHILPLVALQILWVNLVTDGLPALALAVDPPDPDIMKRPPRPPKEGVFTRALATFIGGVGLWTALVPLGVFLWALESGKPVLEAQSLAFVTLIMIELFNCFNCRSERLSIFKVGPFKNRWLLLAVLSSFLVTLPLIYIPFLQGPFHTYPLEWVDWVIVILAGGSVLAVVEIAKLIASRRE